jgi:diguanylate cyclase (GGDEF)-like protein
VALIIRKTLRAYDEAFRAGPDEFCAILSPCDQQIADEVMQRVRDAVAKTLFENEGEYSGRQFSISCGLVFYPGEQNVPEGLLHAAREDMYKKNSQRKVLS